MMISHDSLADLLARCALHDRRAFEALYQQASPMLYGLLLKLTHDRELAADLLQEGFVRIWQRASDYRPTLGQPLTWMGTIVRRLAIDRSRRGDHRRRGELHEDGWAQLADDGPGPEKRLPPSLSGALAGALISPSGGSGLVGIQPSGWIPAHGLPQKIHLLTKIVASRTHHQMEPEG
jgi:RNA polymerase sigma factor (sigma-70 family)